VVTGGSKGIGAGIAKHLAAEGAAVVVTYATSKEDADRVVEEHLERGTTDHLASGISKSHPCVIAADSVRRICSGHE
jgi:3-oxoacyl-[acyl-carrier protein] reductase